MARASAAVLGTSFIWGVMANQKRLLRIYHSGRWLADFMPSMAKKLGVRGIGIFVAVGKRIYDLMTPHPSNGS
jgi:hypothetical protein